MKGIKRALQFFSRQRMNDAVENAKLEPFGQPARLVPPNFFILGAGKSGTTSLYHALKQHPQIHLPSVKEPSFFSRDFHVVANPVEYFNLFPWGKGKKRYGEASHVYFSAPETAPVLHQLFPEAKFILIVRNPVNRSYSLYHHMRRHCGETIESFEEALRVEDARFFNPEFRNNCPQYFWNFMYYRSSLYDIQLNRYLEYFPLRQFFVLTLGEWKSDPGYWQKKIFRFLKIDASVQVNTDPQNQADFYPPLAEETKTALMKKFEGLRERLEKRVGRKLHFWEY